MTVRHCTGLAHPIVYTNTKRTTKSKSYLRLVYHAVKAGKQQDNESYRRPNKNRSHLFGIFHQQQFVEAALLDRLAAAEPDGDVSSGTVVVEVAALKARFELDLLRSGHVDPMRSKPLADDSVFSFEVDAPAIQDGVDDDDDGGGETEHQQCEVKLPAKTLLAKDAAEPDQTQKHPHTAADDEYERLSLKLVVEMFESDVAAADAFDEILEIGEEGLVLVGGDSVRQKSDASEEDDHCHSRRNILAIVAQMHVVCLFVCLFICLLVWLFFCLFDCLFFVFSFNFKG